MKCDILLVILDTKLNALMQREAFDGLASAENAGSANRT